MDGPSQDPALDLARRALAHPPAGLLTDLDGTLAPIVADPAAARPLPGAAEALSALAGRGVVVGVISGRAAADARRMLGRDDLLVVGNHGAEWLEPGAAAPSAAPAPGFASELERALSALPRADGVKVEHKGLSATLHLRTAADPEASAARLLAALQGAALRGVSVRQGRMSIELRPAAGADKGSAVRTVVERNALRGLVVIGDDVTDLDMFAAARQLGASGLATAVIAVAGGDEVPPRVAEAADVVLPDARAVVGLLRALAAQER
jgi:trehalose 6-phosphate phosphatase